MFLHLHLSYRTSASFTQLKNLTVGAPHETEMDAVGYLSVPGKEKESCVEGELLLVALIFGPADIAFVMIFDHHLPCPDRLAMPVAPPCPSFDEGGTFLAFPIHVNSWSGCRFESCRAHQPSLAKRVKAATLPSRKGRRGSRFQLKYRKQPHAK